MSEKPVDPSKLKYQKGVKVKRKAFKSARPDDADTKRQKRLEQKELKKKRKSQRKAGDIVEKAKVIWERVRPGATAISGKKRYALVAELMELIRGKILMLAPKHDGSRVVQWALKAGSREQRREIFDEVKGSLVTLMCAPFGHFVVKACLNYLTKPEFVEMFGLLKGNVRKLLLHKTGSQVLDKIYCLFANSHQQADMVAELYAPSFNVMFPGQESASAEVEAAAAADQAKTPHLPLFHTQLARLLDRYPAAADTVMQYLCKTIETVVFKGTHNTALSHVAMEQYLINASASQRAAMIELLRDALPAIVHTAPGARAAVLAISHGSAKDRKAIVRGFKGIVANMAMEEYGYLVLVHALHVIDDTVLTGKMISKEYLDPPVPAGQTAETTPTLVDLLMHPFASRVFLNVIALVSPRYLSPWQTHVLSLTREDGGEAEGKGSQYYSKKDPSLIQSQVLGRVAESLYTTTTQVAAYAMRETMPANLIVELISSPIDALASFGEAKAALAAAVLDAVLAPTPDAAAANDDDADSDTDEAGAPANSGLLWDFVGSRALKALVRASAPPSDDDTDPVFDFASPLFALLSEADDWASWVTSPGSDFVVLSLLESPVTGDAVAAVLADHSDVLADAGNAGAKLIVKHMAAASSSSSSKKKKKKAAGGKKKKAKAGSKNK